MTQNGVAARAASFAPLVDSHVHVFLDDMQVSCDAWTGIGYGLTAQDLLAVLDTRAPALG